MKWKTKKELKEVKMESSGGTWIGFGFQPLLSRSPTLKPIQVQPSEPNRKISAIIHFSFYK